MASNPPYVPGLPPNIHKDFLDRWSNANPPRPTPVLPPAPAPAQQPTQPAARDGDPIVGTWATTSNGAWHFTKDGDGYALVETSALGQTGQGHAKLEGAILSVNFFSAWLGQMSLTLTLNGQVLQGTIPFMGIPLPFVLQRI